MIFVNGWPANRKQLLEAAGPTLPLVAQVAGIAAHRQRSGNPAAMPNRVLQILSGRPPRQRPVRRG